MKILSPQAALPSDIFAMMTEPKLRECSFFGMDSYDFTALQRASSNAGQSYEILCHFDAFWELAIFENFAHSSQFDRLVHSQIPAGLGPLFALALDGQGFHGQHQNAWATGRGNLYFSASLPCDDLALECANVATLLSCVAAREAIAEHLSFDDRFCSDERLRLAPRCKWINDIVCGDEKIAGCLASLEVEGQRIRRLKLGIGINIEHKPRPDSAYNLKPTCFADFDARNIDAPKRYAALLLSLCRAIEKWSKRWPIDAGRLIRQAYIEDLAYIGREVVLTSDLPPFAWLARGVLDHIDEGLGIYLAGDPRRYSQVRLGLAKT